MKKNRELIFTIISVFVLLVSCNSKTSKSDVLNNQTSIILLGVYHFNNPGKDTYNIEVDNYFTDKRQNEIKEVITQLEKFKPTKIFVEYLPSSQKRIDSLYKLYLENKITLKDIKNGQNEVYQLGFNLGKALNGIPIKAVDHKGVWLGNYVDFIADTLSLKFYKNDNKQSLKLSKLRQQKFLSNSIKENLVYLNEDKQITNNHNYYNNIAIRVKDTTGIMYKSQNEFREIDGLTYYMRSFDFNNIGIELASEWYKRNLFIYRNILENTKKHDRILVVFGYGHIKYLRQFFLDNSNYNLVNTLQFLKN